MHMTTFFGRRFHHDIGTKLEETTRLERTLAFQWSVRYSECDLAPQEVEYAPVLQMYLSNHFDERETRTGGLVTIKLNEDDANATQSGHLRSTLNPSFGTVIPAGAALALCSYAIHRNDFGVACYTEVGTARIPLGELMTELKTSGRFQHQLPLVLHSGLVAGMQPIQKGVVELTITNAALGSQIRWMTDIAHSQMMVLGSDESNTTIAQYIRQTLAMESAIPDTLPKTERIRAPMDLGEVSILSTIQTFLPAAAFSLTEVPRSNAGYWRNAFARIMARRNMTVGTFYDLDQKERCRTLGLMINYAVQTFDYIGDAIEMGDRRRGMMTWRHLGTDSWSNGWQCFCGDCEDLTKALNSCDNAFLGVSFDATIDRPLIDMQKEARTYMPLMSLFVVHGAKIGDQEGWGAHMVLMMMPKHQWENALSKTNMGRQLLARMGIQVPEWSDAEWARLNHEHPFFFCEGTGHIDPIGAEPGPAFAADYDRRKYIGTNMHSAGAFKKEIPCLEGHESTFYYAGLFSLSDRLMKTHGINVGGFVLGQVADNPAGMTRGILWTDLLQGNRNVAITPQPPIPAQVMGLIRDAVSLEPPARPIVLQDELAREPIPAPPSTHPELDRYVAAVKNMSREGPPRRGERHSVDLFARPHHLDENVINRMIGETQQPHHLDENVINRMIGETQQLDRIYDAAYEREDIVDGVYSWRIQLFVK